MLMKPSLTTGYSKRSSSLPPYEAMQLNLRQHTWNRCDALSTVNKTGKQLTTRGDVKPGIKQIVLQPYLNLGE